MKCDNCIKDYLGIKNLCECQDCDNQYYLSDFVPSIRLQYFSDLATEEHQTGAQLASSLITGAEVAVMSDITRAAPGGVSVDNRTLQDCSKCSFTSIYTPDTALVVDSFNKSDLSLVTISKLSFRTDFDGLANLVITDFETGDELYSAEVTLVDGEAQTVTLTTEQFTASKLLIKFDDPLIGLSNISCPTSGCGCSKKTNKSFRYLGYKDGKTSNQQYGFIPCVAHNCNPQDLVCTVLASMKTIVANAIAYKVAIQVYSMILSSTIYKDTQMNIDMETVEKNINTLEGKYHELIHGTKSAYGRGASNGIVQAYQSTAKALSSNDKCISCNAPRYTASAMN